jgi:hypothetical protein
MAKSSQLVALVAAAGVLAAAGLLVLIVLVVPKRHIISDRRGVPLAVALTAANVHDSMVFEELIDAVEPIKRPGRGRPRRRPEKLHADKAYDDKCKGALRRRGIKHRIARKGIERVVRSWGDTDG